MKVNDCQRFLICRGDGEDAPAITEVVFFGTDQEIGTALQQYFQKWRNVVPRKKCDPHEYNVVTVFCGDSKCYFEVW